MIIIWEIFPEMNKYLREKIVQQNCYKLFVSSSSLILVAETHSTNSEEITTIASNQQPYFDFDVQRNLTVTVGQTAFMHCRVERLGDKDVS
jgi:hypothetical protein